MRPPLGLSILSGVLLSACLSFEAIEDPPGSSDDPDAEPAEEVADAAPGTPDAAADSPDAAPASTETLAVAFNTALKNPEPYAPRNIVAVWVEAPGGAFVKTIGRWANRRRTSLVAWTKQSGGNDVDAVSGATRPDHQTRLNISWNFLDKAGKPVPDGTYTIRMELADTNADVETDNHEATFTVTKNGTASKQTVAGPGFLNVQLDYSGRP